MGMCTWACVHGCVYMGMCTWACVHGCVVYFIHVPIHTMKDVSQSGPQAYQSWILGNLKFEHQKWQEALDAFGRAQ